MRFQMRLTVRVFGKQGVQHAVRNLVGQLIWMSHADGFTGEQVFSNGHGSVPFPGQERYFVAAP